MKPLMKPCRMVPAALLLVSAVAGSAAAQDDSLYPAPSSPDASFLRIVMAEPVTVRINGDAVAAEASGVTPYVEIAEGDQAIMIGDITETVAAEPATHYTYVVGRDGVGALVPDTPSESPSQAALTLYNLTDLDATEVYVPSADTVALADIGALEAATVALRAPLSLDVELRAGGQTLAALPAVELRRGVGTSIILAGEPGAYTARSFDNFYE
jgi:alginate O-acetyltransferase complex protein AlgF